MKYGLQPDRFERHPKFYTKAGWLTPYALACGYTQTYEEAALECRLDYISGGSYRVTVVRRPPSPPFMAGSTYPWTSHHEHIIEARRWYKLAPLKVALGLKPVALGLR